MLKRKLLRNNDTEHPRNNNLSINEPEQRKNVLLSDNAYPEHPRNPQNENGKERQTMTTSIQETLKMKTVKKDKQ